MGDNMKKIIISAIFTIIIITSYIVFNRIVQLNNQTISKTENSASVRVFKKQLLENIIESIKDKSDEAQIKLSDYTLVKYEEKSFVNLDILQIPKSNFLIQYEGLYVISIHLNIGELNDENSKMVSDIATILIKVSDLDLTEIEAKQIFSQLIKQVNSKKTSTYIKYKNGLVYNLSINDDVGINLYVE